MLLTARADATSIMVTFDAVTLQATPGQTITFSGTIHNTGPERVFLNTDTLTLPGGGFTVDDLFFQSVPAWLEPGESSVGSLPLFRVTVDDPYAVEAFGSYLGSYSLAGGFDDNAQDQLITAPFTVVTAAPEPWTGSMFMMGILGAVFARLCRDKYDWRHRKPVSKSTEG
jgi:hypothetical protein